MKHRTWIFVLLALGLTVQWSSCTERVPPVEAPKEEPHTQDTTTADARQEATPEPTPEPHKETPSPGDPPSEPMPEPMPDLTPEHVQETTSDQPPRAGLPFACPTIKPTQVPAKLGLDPFYKKYVDAGGIPLVGSSNVPDQAFVQAYYVLANMLQEKPCIRKAIVESGILVGIIAASEVTTQMPEYKDLNKAFPQIDWDKRARGLGATLLRPLTTGAEENLLRLRNDRYKGENILLHEFAHSFFTFGIAALQDGAQHQATLNQLYQDAKRAGLWEKTYARSTVQEYWAETVQSWFSNNISADPPNGIHNNISTRKKLEAYDPKMAAFIARFFSAKAWSPYCETSGQTRPWKDPTPQDPHAATCTLRRAYLPAQACSKLPSLRSPSGGVSQRVTFVNRSDATTYGLEQIDGSGKRQKRATLGAKNQRSLITQKGHHWVVTDNQGKCLATFTATHEDNVVTLPRKKP